MRIAEMADLREAARRRLPRMLFEYIDGGANAERTLASNTADFAAIRLRQRVLRDASRLDLSTVVLGETLAMPIGLGPVGMAGMYARRGEIQAARAAARAGIPFSLSTVALCSAAEVARAAQAPWFQLYMLRDRGFMQSLISRAKEAGCRVLVFTVDLPTPGARHRDVRSGFTGTRGLERLAHMARDGLGHPRWLWDVWLMGRPHRLGNVVDAAGEGAPDDFLGWISQNFDRSVTWADLEWVRRSWDGPLVVKGVLEVEDARQAVRVGAQALVVSNHGGRQLDGVRSSISALPAIADALGSEVELLLDGGVRSGLDVLKALALGAKACLLGRGWAWALGAGGGPAVGRMLEMLRAELEVAMVLTGCPIARDAGRHILDLDASALFASSERAE